MKNKKIGVAIILVIVCVLVGVGVVVTKSINHQTNDNIKKYDYDINNIKNIEISMTKESEIGAIELYKVMVTEKDVIQSILSNATTLEYVKEYDHPGLVTNVSININYNEKPTIKIIILDNGNLVIDFNNGTEDSKYTEYKISNTNLASELKEKYK